MYLVYIAYKGVFIRVLGYVSAWSHVCSQAAEGPN